MFKEEQEIEDFLQRRGYKLETGECQSGYQTHGEELYKGVIFPLKGKLTWNTAKVKILKEHKTLICDLCIMKVIKENKTKFFQSSLSGSVFSDSEFVGNNITDKVCSYLFEKDKNNSLDYSRIATRSELVCVIMKDSMYEKSLYKDRAWGSGRSIS